MNRKVTYWTPLEVRLDVLQRKKFQDAGDIWTKNGFNIIKKYSSIIPQITQKEGPTHVNHPYDST